MKIQFNVSKSALDAAASALSRVINPRAPIPVMSNILFRVQGDTLHMRASDSEVTINTTVPLAGFPSTSEECSFCAPATCLCSALEAISEQMLTITVVRENSGEDGDNTMRIAHNTGETYFGVEGSDEYPMPAEAEYATTITVRGDRLREAMRCTLWATGADELRAQLCGVHLNSTPQGLDVVGTDGRALSRYTLKEVSGDCTATLPRNAVKTIMSVMGEDDVTLSFSSTRGAARTGAYTVSFVLAEGAYPNYNAVIPRDTKRTSIANRDALMGSIRRVSPFGNAASGLLTLIFSGNTLTMKGADTNYGYGAIDNASISFDGEATTIGVNGPMFQNVLSHIESAEVFVKMSDPQRPVVITPAGNIPDTDILMMAMPMRVD